MLYSAISHHVCTVCIEIKHQVEGIPDNASSIPVPSLEGAIEGDVASRKRNRTESTSAPLPATLINGIHSTTSNGNGVAVKMESSTSSTTSTTDDTTVYTTHTLFFFFTCAITHSHVCLCLCICILGGRR
jgi:hypothetical protein